MPRGIPNPKPDNVIVEDHKFSAEPINEAALEAGQNAPKPTSQTKGLNALTNYQPSPERNAIDQASQPTGTGSVAGGLEGFDEDNLDETTIAWRPEPISTHLAKLAGDIAAPEPIEVPQADEKLFPVRLLRNYRPATDRWYPLLSNGKLGKKPVSEEGLSLKVGAGYFITLPISEAKQIIKRGIAERADSID